MVASQCIPILILGGLIAVYSQGMFKLSSRLYGKATAVTCYGSPTFVQNVSCKLKAKSWEHNLAYYEADLVDVIKNLSLRLEFYKLTNQFRPFLLNFTLNFCDMFEKGRSSNPYIQMILSIMFKYSNLHHKCPFTGHLYVHNIYVDFDIIPFYIPVGTYKLMFNFYDGWPYDWVARLTYTFKIAEKKNTTRTLKTEKELL